MATKPTKQPEQVRYFIVEKDRLSDYGNAEGSDTEEAQRLLAESVDSAGDYVVIKGTLIKPTFKLED